MREDHHDLRYDPFGASRRVDALEHAERAVESALAAAPPDPTLERDAMLWRLILFTKRHGAGG